VLKSFHLGVDSNDLNVEQNHCNKIIAPRRQGAKKNTFFSSELGVLCGFARDKFFRSALHPDISNTFD
jgi:hypothetical protein